jgi:hypothetical protein
MMKLSNFIRKLLKLTRSILLLYIIWAKFTMIKKIMKKPWKAIIKYLKLILPINLLFIILDLFTKNKKILNLLLISIRKHLKLNQTLLMLYIILVLFWICKIKSLKLLNVSKKLLKKLTQTIRFPSFLLAFAILTLENSIKPSPILTSILKKSPPSLKDTTWKDTHWWIKPNIKNL